MSRRQHLNNSMKSTQGRMVGYIRAVNSTKAFNAQRDALVKYGVPVERIFHDRKGRDGLRRAIKVCWPDEAIVTTSKANMGRNQDIISRRINEIESAGVEMIALSAEEETRGFVGGLA